MRQKTLARLCTESNQSKHQGIKSTAPLSCHDFDRSDDPANPFLILTLPRNPFSISTEVNISIQLESKDSKWFFFLRAEIFNLECFVQKYSYYGVLCKNIGQVLLHVTRPSRLTVWIWPMSLECFLKPWKMRQNNVLYETVQIAQEKTLIGGFLQKYY